MYGLPLRTTACIPNQIPRERIAAGGLRLNACLKLQERGDAEKLLCAQATNTCRTDSVSTPSIAHVLGRPGGPPSRDPLAV
jgi:hypothetical protein